jgi:hypothetical protein
MVIASIIHNLVNDETAKVADELLKLVMLVWIPLLVFLFFPLQENKFRSSISY